jgi:phosphonate transport system substrate-binding protein
MAPMAAPSRSAVHAPSANTLDLRGPERDLESVNDPGDFDAGATGPLRIGMMLSASAAGSPDAMASQHVVRASLQAFAAALGRAVGVSARPADFSDYPALLEAMYEGEIDIAWLPPIIAMRAAAAGRALPIALPMRRGVASFHSALFTQVGSPIQRPPDLSGARGAWVDRQSASGYLLIRAALRAQGVNLAQAFSEDTFLGSHQAVVQAVMDGRADVGATFLHYDAAGTGVWRAGWGANNVHVIARVGPIPADVIAAGVHVPVPLIRAVQKALIDGEHDEVLRGASALMESDRFVAATSEHLKPLEDLLDFLEDAAHPWHSIAPPPNVRVP